MATTAVHDTGGGVVSARMSMGAVWTAATLFAVGPVLVGLTSVSGAVLSFWRMWMGVALFGVVAAAHVRRNGYRASAAGWKLAGVAGVCFAAHQIMMMSAIHEASVVDVTLMQTLCPVVVGAMAVPLFGERPARSFLGWAGLAILGAALVALSGSVGPTGNPFGMALAAGNVVGYSVFFVLSKRALSQMDGWLFLLGSFVTGTLAVSAYNLGVGSPLGSISGHDLLIALALAVVPGLLGHGLMTWALRTVPANLPPIVMLMCPLIAGGLAWVVLDQAITAGKVAAGALTLGGVLGAVRSPVQVADPLDPVPAAVEALALAEEI